ncbi:MAG: hypothetical protein AAGG51_12730 [Cyanobacteria bacterium P01_G01_bin.54]
MFILNADQVEFCLLHNPTTDPSLRQSGIQFQEQVYVQGKIYPLQAKVTAVREAQAYPSTVHGSTALLVQDQTQLTLWYVDPALQKVDDPLVVDLQQLIEVMRRPGMIPWETKAAAVHPAARWFRGCQAVNWLSQRLQISRIHAVQIGQQLMDHQLIRPVQGAQFFEDSLDCYWFCLRSLDPATVNLASLAQAMQAVEGVAVQDRQYRLRTYSQCFVGSEAVTWLSHHFTVSRENAIAIGQRLLKYQWIAHVLREHPFKDDYLFYRFCERE